jgi:hypothetical protein
VEFSYVFLPSQTQTSKVISVIKAHCTQGRDTRVVYVWFSVYYVSIEISNSQTREAWFANPVTEIETVVVPALILET